MERLIIESGATKSDWRLLKADGTYERRLLPGMNLSSMPLEQVLGVVRQGLGEFFPHGGQAGGFHLYTAGVCTDDIRTAVCSVVRCCAEFAEIEIENDLIGAARAVCGHGSGVVAIMGTGSNSCFFDGRDAEFRTRSGGFILGDEGGAAALGRLFLSDFIKGLVSEEVSSDFGREFDASYANIVEQVYRSGSPSAYLGSLAPFIVRHYDDPSVKTLVDRNFREFIERSLLKYPVKDHPLGVVGGFGWACRDIFTAIAGEYGIKVSVFMPQPIEGLLKYHSAD